MRRGKRIGVVIPALDEEAAIGRVVDAVPGWVDEVVVVNNASTDATATVARAHGARVVDEKRRGYGVACRAGIDALDDSEVVVFLDGDFSDRPEQMARLVDPIVEDRADFVLGNRVCEERDGHSMTRFQRMGNRLACGLINGLWRARYSDLGPFRAIRRSALQSLELRDRNFGWTVEMQIKAVRRGLRVQEVSTSYRHRIGHSKISGTFSGAVGAGAKILFVILQNRLQRG
ncbi:MAG: glycosyltransferase [Gammaproteobacteria bacterium]|nr:MAG: glycosyltransferase [Gammaproteobacteria bacterium]